MLSFLSFLSRSILQADQPILAGEVRVVLEQEKHDLFERDGSSPHLSHTATISVLESLVGCSVAVTSLSGKSFNVPVTDVVA